MCKIAALALAVPCLHANRTKMSKASLNTEKKLKKKGAHCKAGEVKTVQTSAEREEMREAQKEASQIWPPYSEMECNSEGE